MSEGAESASFLNSVTTGSRAAFAELGSAASPLLSGADRV